MNRRALGVLAALGATIVIGAGVAPAHQSGCHSAHSCPSDHHAYVWYDGAGQGWDCVKPGAPEYDPSHDTSVITYDGYTYYCRAAGSPPPLPPPPPIPPPPPTITPPADVEPEQAPVRCGVERWPVKTLSDDRASVVDFKPKRTTVNALRRLDVPRVGRDTPRLDVVETATYRVRAQIVQAKREKDHDIHLVIAAGSNRRKTMIVEFPDVGCGGPADSAKKPEMRQARHAFTRACGSAPSTSFKKLRGTATITGVGFVDVKHGQRGIAPNGIEIHPVLRFRSANCKRG
jgi:hypothetical protein